MRQMPSSAAVPAGAVLVLAGAIVVLASVAFAAAGPEPPAAPAAGGPAASVRQASFDASLFRALRWRNIGPVRGGRSLTVAGSPGRPLEYYFGAVGGGLWKTVDGGIEWEPVTDGQIGSSSVGAVAVAESAPDVVYIGMGEVQLRGSVMQGDGVYRSIDGGANWQHLGLEETRAIGRIRVHPTDADVVWVAALGHPYGPNQERGVFRSRDGGDTWQQVLYVSDRAGAADLVLDRTDPDVLYATTWEVSRTPWRLWSGGPGSGLWKTADGGDTWVELTHNPGMPAGPIGRIGIAVSPADPQRVWALVEANEGGVFRSDDGGTTWTRTSDDPRLRQRAFDFSRLTADPLDRNTVYALNAGLYRSDDGGVTFDVRLRPPHDDHHDLWIAPGDPTRMASANDGGGTVSFNGGETWTDQDHPTAQLHHVTTTLDFPYHVCGAQQDRSTICVPSDDWRHMSRGGPWMYSVGGGESGYVTRHPTDPDVFYAGSHGALLTRYDRSSGQIRDIQVYPRFFSGEPASALPERWPWTFPVVFSPVDPGVLFTSSQHVWKTTNDGQTWERISPDLTRAEPETLDPSGGPVAMGMSGPEIYATVFALTPGHHDDDVIWAGSDDGLVHLTRDGGESWQDVTPPDMPRHTRVSIIEASPHDPATAYVAAKRYQMDDRAPYIWRTRDQGATWTRIVDGIPDGDYVHVVREDTVRPGLLYAGTEHGVHVSFDAGASWQSLSLNLPDTQVADLVVEEHDLVAGTHGRSIWVLDDIEPIRELGPEVADAGVWLFQPADAVRGVAGLVVQYSLRPGTDVALEILDDSGGVIRSFRGRPGDGAAGRAGEAVTGAGPAGQDPADSAAAPRIDAPVPPTADGLNRFEWDLHYPGAVTFDGMIMRGARPWTGPLAPPGGYRVRLSAGGRTLTRNFRVVRDPRLEGVTDADLQEQFDLALRIRDRTSAANEAVIQIRDLRAQIVDRLDRTDSEELQAAGQEIVDGITAVEEQLHAAGEDGVRDPQRLPARLGSRLAALRSSVETGDARPTDAAYVVFEELAEELDQRLADLDDILSSTLPTLNRFLRDLGLEPVQPRLPAS